MSGAPPPLPPPPDLQQLEEQQLCLPTAGHVLRSHLAQAALRPVTGLEGGRGGGGAGWLKQPLGQSPAWREAGCVCVQDGSSSPRASHRLGGRQGRGGGGCRKRRRGDVRGQRETGREKGRCGLGVVCRLLRGGEGRGAGGRGGVKAGSTVEAFSLAGMPGSTLEAGMPGSTLEAGM